MSIRRAAPHTIAGLAGMLLVATLYVAHALLLRGGGHGLSAAWLLSLLLPGALAAHICVRSGIQPAFAKEGALSGLFTGHVAAGVQVAWLIIAVATTDWARYAQEVGPDIAYAVRDLAVPATALAAVIGIVVTYAGCIGASLLGSLFYAALHGILTK
jgi:hypothetical protein